MGTKKTKKKEEINKAQHFTPNTTTTTSQNNNKKLVNLVNVLCFLLLCCVWLLIQPICLHRFPLSIDHGQSNYSCKKIKSNWKLSFFLFWEKKDPKFQVFTVENLVSRKWLGLFKCHKSQIDFHGKTNTVLFLNRRSTEST